MTANKPVLLAYFKSTKGTHVYKTENPDAAVTSLYVKRDSLPIVPPQAIELSLTYTSE